MHPAAYTALISSLQDYGYVFGGFTGHDYISPKENRVILRHDVDFSLGLAAQMAVWEADRGVAAQYFVQMTSPLYNTLSGEAREHLARIAAGGHGIGLHFDSALYRNASADDVRSELEALAAVVPGSVLEIVSLHRPRMGGLEQIRDWATSRGVRTTYDAPWTTEYLYCSDSRGTWKYGDVADVGRRFLGRRLQLLIHPLWWLVDGPTPSSQLRNFSAAAVDVTRRYLRETAVSFDF